MLIPIGHEDQQVRRLPWVTILLVAANVLVEGLKRTGPQLDTERLVEGLEGLRDLDLGLGTLVNFGRTEHQGIHKVWGTQLDASGRYQPIELQ